MLPGVDAEKPCFGPAEIYVLRRALELAEGALVNRRPLARRAQLEQRQQLAKSIIQLAITGELDPVVLSAAALGSAPLPVTVTTKPASAHPRRPPRLRPVDARVI